MFCTKCGKKIDDTSQFCPYCGASTSEDIEELGEVKQENYIREEQPQYRNQEPQMKSNKVPIVVLGIVLVLVAGFIGFFLANQNQSSDVATSEVTTKEDTSAVTTEAVTTQATTEAITTEATTQTPYRTGVDYVFPYSNTEYLSRSQVAGLSSWDLKVARNEIFARHGYIFKNKSLQSYFESKSWYRGTRSGEISDDELNRYEKENIKLIKVYE
ncbi:MAG: YARHG domain-containing protein [Anaerostipes sp.]|nr:YARHG domain-containing protein [Anaerostipes sp.]